MPLTKGLALRAGFAREATVTAPTWPAASAAAITALLPLLDVQPNDGVTKAGAHATTSGLGPVAFDVLSIMPSATVSLKTRYQGLEQLWACALGQCARIIGATTMPEVIATGVYRHLMELSPALSTAELWEAGQGQPAGARKVRRGTLAVDMQVSVWEFLSAMVQAFTLQASPEEVTLRLDLVSYSLERASSINTSVTMAKLPPPPGPGVLFTDLVWRVAPYSASTPLGSGDVVQCTSWALRVENNLMSGPGPRTGLQPEEYERTSDPTVTLTGVVPRHIADTWQTRWGANTVLMADAKCTSETLITVGQPYRLNVYLPSCQVTNAQLNVAGPRTPPDTVVLVGVVPSAAAAGMPAMSGLSPCAVEVYSGAAAHALVG